MQTDPVQTWLFVALGFLLGSIPFGYLIARFGHGEDLREHGSGNIGMTNVWRNYGMREGLTCFVLDVGKGLVPVYLFTTLITPGTPEVTTGEILVGAAAVLGHVFTPWLGFDGGKGIATGLGVATAWLGIWVFVPVLVFGATVGLTKMVSAGSLLGAVGFAVACWLPESVTGHSLTNLRWIAVVIVVFVFWTHRGNIARIIRGEESKIGRDDDSEEHETGTADGDDRDASTDDDGGE